MGISGRPELEDDLIVPLENFGVRVMSMGLLLDEDTPVVWRGPMMMQALTQMLHQVAWGTLDYLIVDLPPGTGDVVLTTLQEVHVDGVVVVTTPFHAAVTDTERSIELFADNDVPVLGVVLNMAGFTCEECGTLHDTFPGNDPSFDAPVLAELPFDPDLQGTPTPGDVPGPFADLGRRVRRAVEDGVPNPVAIEEYSHYSLVARVFAGARDLPFVPVRTLVGSDLPDHTEAVRTVENPYDPADEVAVVPPLNPDVAVVRAQRASPEGDAHVWGITGDVVDAAFAADTVVLSVEEVVDTATLRSDPNRTEIPGLVVDHVVEEPYGSHPSYTQGYYGRDNAAYLEWDDVSRTHESTTAWLDEWVHGVADRREYVEKLGVDRLLDLEPKRDYAEPIDVGRYA